MSATKRRPYVRGMKASWWKKLDFYKMYMVREATCLPTVWFCIVLFYGAVALSKGTFATDFVGFLQNPFVVVLNIISLAAMFYHAATLYVMTPEVMSVMVKGKHLPVSVGRNILWAVTAVISLIALILVYI
ncbi:reductase [Mannheimia varigena USDA-ARS-USMARC-1388]|nr:fumarate reductase subunit FrdC [Mannheimia varigena]AHG80650.1 reductase [Mannheimia varigena USDA-ARS-USMARC-1388]MDY2947452.1 fumarate reductase subunit FrdC [Mannheimia varigena]QLB17303.1 fumarate reductase subunit C [Mannheimia varigena]QLD33985.1 fumarate reductase subunit FrdC [Mannheimia varigena]TLU76702.1 fumarate reductase subunit FrdC [Mannheimia varigena]